jgi:HEAT repeat protein
VGIFDFLKGGRSKTDAPPAAGPDKKLASLIKTATDKRAQQYDRDEALRKLVEVGTPDAAEGLLKRFSVQVDPSITDEDEKQIAYDGIVAIGQGRKGDHEEAEIPELKTAVIERTRAYCKTAANLTWALKVLRALESDAEYEDELLELLRAFDTEYMRNVEPKLNLLAALEQVKSEEARLAVEEYLGDVNETVRFHAVQTLFEEGDPAAIPALVGALEHEESVRIKNKVADGFIRCGWRVPAELRDKYRSYTGDAYEYRMSDDGAVAKI